MAKKQAEPEKESVKKHGDKLGQMLKEMDGDGSGAGVDPIPMPEDGGHEKSHAAHLGGTVHDRTKPEGNLRHGAAPGALREPPMVVQRVGKQHR